MFAWFLRRIFAPFGSTAAAANGVCGPAGVVAAVSGSAGLTPAVAGPAGAEAC